MIAESPMQRLLMDLVNLTAYREENDGYGYLCNIVDCFSQYAWSFPVKSKEAREVLECLIKVSNELCPPQILHSDNGGEFVNELIALFASHYGIHIVHGAPHHPNVQGRVERWNQTVERQLGKGMEEKHTRRWLDLLPRIVKAYNITRHEVTNRTPFEVLHGFVPKILYEVPIGPMQVEYSEYNSHKNKN